MINIQTLSTILSSFLWIVHIILILCIGAFLMFISMNLKPYISTLILLSLITLYVQFSSFSVDNEIQFLHYIFAGIFGCTVGLAMKLLRTQV